MYQSEVLKKYIRVHEHTQITLTSIDIILSITYGHVYNTRGGLTDVTT